MAVGAGERERVSGPKSLIHRESTGKTPRSRLLAGASASIAWSAHSWISKARKLDVFQSFVPAIPPGGEETIEFKGVIGDRDMRSSSCSLLRRGC